MTMMMPLPTRGNGVLGPERAVQEMAARERRTGHAGDCRDARTEGCRVRAAAAHAEREHAIEHFPSIN